MLAHSCLPVPLRRRATATRLQGASYLLDLEALDHVPGLNILVVLECHASFVAVADFAHLILEALQRFHATLVNDVVVAHQPYHSSAPDYALGDLVAVYLYY